MNDKEWNPVRKRNVIIFMGISILLIALLIEPSPWALLTSRLGLLKMVLSIVSGFVFAIGIAQIAERALKSTIEPVWYARSLGLASLAVGSGKYDFALALGLEKMPRGFMDPTQLYEDWQIKIGLSQNPMYWALNARRHMAEYGTTIEQLGKIALKNHKNSVHNATIHTCSKCI